MFVRGRIHKGSDGSILKEARWTWRLEGSESLQARSQHLQRQPPHEAPLHDDDARFIQTISYNEARQFPPRLRVLSTRSSPSLREGEEQASGYQPSFLSFLSLSFSSLDTTSRSDEEELANDNVHTQGVQIYSRIHEHTQGVESL